MRQSGLNSASLTRLKKAETPVFLPICKIEPLQALAVPSRRAQVSARLKRSSQRRKGLLLWRVIGIDPPPHFSLDVIEFDLARLTLNQIITVTGSNSLIRVQTN